MSVPFVLASHSTAYPSMDDTSPPGSSQTADVQHPPASDRDEALHAVRPVVPVDTSESRPVERFQHEVLRPVFKLLNPVLLQIVTRYLTKYGTGFAGMDRADQVRRLENLLTQDSRLKRTVQGMAIGHFTEAEAAFYLDHESELRRRMVELVTQRVVDQVDRVAELVDEEGGD